MTGKGTPPVAGKQQRFLWRGLLIVLPALAMAGFGFVSLRQDRLLVRHQAAEQAEKDALEAQTGAQMEEAPGAAGTAAMAQPGPRRAAIQTMPSRSRGVNPAGGRAGGEQTRMAA